ncbi:MAG: hypothetical protein ACTHVE_01155 [Senegalia sp. (in: firmicutes)]|uniref:hypothetical protein n=1 Tax=Senegalia sp. (in: firmicutes) TaxID=1924098 RepID=UPI003F956D72
MEFMTGAFRVFLLYIIVSNILRIIYTLINRKKIAQRIEEAKKQQNQANDNTKVAEKEEQIEYVIDPICKEKIAKNDAHILLEDDKKIYFHSWECRQEYIDRKKEN